MKKVPPDPENFSQSPSNGQDKTPDTLTRRQKATALAYMGDPDCNKITAAKRGGYKVKKGSRIQQVFRVINTNIGAVLRKEFDMTDADVAQVVFDATKAEKVRVVYEKTYEEGKLTKVKPVVVRNPDHAIRLKAITFTTISPKAPFININMRNAPNEASVDALNARMKKNEVEAEYEVADAVS